MSTELAWAAGFFDGEGCTATQTKGHNVSVRAAITQKDRRVLDRFQRAVGLGKVYKAAEDRFIWTTPSDPATRETIALLWPYLDEIKRSQAERCFAASTWHDGHRNRLLCKDPTHEIVPRSDNKGRRCRTCNLKQQRAAHQRRKAAT